MLRLTVLLLLTAIRTQADGEVRLRLFRRFPDCRGTLEDVYAGDEWSFMERIEFGVHPVGGVLLLEKDRGEEWIDLVSGGLACEPDNGAGPSFYAGWLEARFGSGLVLAHPGAWSGSGPGTYSKPPSIRSRIRLSRSSWSADGNGLTGVAGCFSVGNVSFHFLQGLSRIDRSEGGYHRTSGEIDSRGAVRETLSAVRMSVGPLGVTAAAGSEKDEETLEWQRAGIDLQFAKGAFLLSGEAALGIIQRETSVAWWGSMTQSTADFRHSLTAYGVPGVFPGSRSSPPVDGNSDPGIRYGFRWKVFPGTTVSAGARLLLREGGNLTASAQLERRFGSGLEGRISYRSSSSGGETSRRLLSACTWEPGHRLSLTGRLQFTRWSGADSTECGTAFEFRVKYAMLDELQLRAGAAAFSTGGYSSRVYAAELAFPGEFGSIALYDMGFLLQASAMLRLHEHMSIRTRIAWQTREGAGHLGSGWEETGGPERTEAGLQLDYSF